MEQELATNILPKFFKKCGFKDTKKMFYQLSLHTDTKEKRISMLNQKRSNTLEEIHKREKQIEYLDYIKYEIQKT